MKKWSNLAKIVARRTYARNDSGIIELWPNTVERVIRGNLSKFDKSKLQPYEAENLERLMLERKAMPAGRGLWFSGSPGHERLGGAALNNCYYFSIDNWKTVVDIQDMLMLGGGCGASVEHRFVSKIAPVRKNVTVVHKNTKDADFIVPDSREGWCELTRRVLEAFLKTGKSFSYSTVCVRGGGEPIIGFGGTASGPRPLIAFISKISAILQNRSSKHLRPIDMADIICATGEMVVAGNVRRSAIIILGDPWDNEYLTAKRWDLGQLPTQRAMANWSVVASSTEELTNRFWQTYEHGEAFGIVNRKAIQSMGRIGEPKPDTAVGVNPCAEACLESYEACNLQEINLANLDNVEEFELAGRLMHRWGRRVAMEAYHTRETAKVVKNNHRIGTGITGCLAAPDLFDPDMLDRVYNAIQDESRQFSREFDVPESIRTTVVKPSGTLSKVMDTPWAAGIHGAYSRFFIQRIRFSAEDKLIPLLRAAGHHIEPVIRFDGTLDESTLVVEFYLDTPPEVPTADDELTLQKQLDILLKAQKHWSDQAVSVTIYYRKTELPFIKNWLDAHLSELKSISFLCHNDHGFKQAPWEAITEAQFKDKSKDLKDLDIESVGEGSLESMECEGGACPIK